MARKWLYSFGIVAVFILYLPKLLWDRFYKNKYKHSLSYRLGLKWPDFQPSHAPAIWIHAVSLGEVKAAFPLVMQLKKTYPDFAFFISCTTETGLNEAKRVFSFANSVFFLPFDFPWTMTRLVRKISPQLLILVEGDLWFNLLDAAKKFGSKILLVNGKLSERSFRRYSRYSFYTKWVFSLIDHCALQNDLYLSRFRSLQINNTSITGNLKFDIKPPLTEESQLLSMKTALGISLGDFVITIGSTHPGEEDLLLKALTPLLEEHSSIKILIAPRHPERFDVVASLMNTLAIRHSKWSECMANSGKKGERVVLVDVMGYLNICYQLSLIAIVAGSFVDIGGHNLLEPLAFGTPVLFGPYMDKQKELASLVTSSRVGFQVTIDTLLSQLDFLIRNPSLREHIRQRAQELLQAHSGAALRTSIEAEKLLKISS